MKVEKYTLRRITLAVLLIGFLSLCGWLVGFQAVAVWVLSSVLVLAPILGGALYVFRRFPDMGIRATAIWAAIVGVTVGVGALLGMAFGDLVRRDGWGHVVTYAAGIAVATFLLITVGSLIWSTAINVTRR